jgi:hypothetical protein
MRFTMLTSALLLSATNAANAANAAKADPYRWCVLDLGMMGSSNCYFVTLEQCKAAASGNGGMCGPNVFYTGPAEPSPRPAKKKK